MAVNEKPVLPGGTLGVLGGGQLGRMLALAAKRMGYRVHVLDPVADCPAAQSADLHVAASYDDAYAVRQFAQGVDVITFEFENVPAETLRTLTAVRPIYPTPDTLHTSRHRVREKRFLQSAGVPVAPFAVCESEEDVRQACGQLALPGVLKSAEFGYDGKGQRKVATLDEALLAWRTIDARQCVLEQFIPFTCELSVVCARGRGGEFRAYPPVRNDHANHILDLTTAPADLPPTVALHAVELAHRIAQAIGLVGVMAVEMFLVGEELIVNELAPRPHNSGHFTFDACVTSQFEQQLRAVCGLPLGDTRMLTPGAAMANLLGDLWFDASGALREPDWIGALAIDDVKLHLYAKDAPKRGRKMGHLCALAHSPAAAKEKVIAARKALRG